MIAKKIAECMKRWGIDKNQVMIFVTDNESNMLKAVRELNNEMSLSDSDNLEQLDVDNNDEEEEDTEVTESDTEDQSDQDDATSEANTVSISEWQAYRFPCMAHSLQLVVNTMHKHDATERLITKAKVLVKTVRKSSVATTCLVKTCGKTLVKCNATRWNNTLFMVERLLEIQVPLKEVLDKQGVDGLLASEWTKLDELFKLLKPLQVSAIWITV